MITPNHVYAGSNKIDLTVDTKYVHPAAKQCNYVYTHPTSKQCNYSYTHPSEVQCNVQSLIQAKSEIFVGTYHGDGSLSRTISIGFTPIAVLIFDRGWNTGPATNGIERVFGGLALAGYNVYDSEGNMAISITSNGFIVSVNYSAYTNRSGYIYHYIAFK